MGMLNNLVELNAFCFVKKQTVRTLFIYTYHSKMLTESLVMCHIVSLYCCNAYTYIYIYIVPSQIAPRDEWQRPGNNVFGQCCYYAMDRMTPITRLVNKTSEFGNNTYIQYCTITEKASILMLQSMIKCDGYDLFLLCLFVVIYFVAYIRHTLQSLLHDMTVSIESVKAILTGKSRNVYALTTQPGKLAHNN